MDWTKIIADLLNSGLRQAEIGHLVGLSQARVSELSRGDGTDMRWKSGQRLLELHGARCAAEDPDCALALQLRRPSGPVACGACLNCGEPLEQGGRWCDADCRADWEARLHNGG